MHLRLERNAGALTGRLDYYRQLVDPPAALLGSSPLAVTAAGALVRMELPVAPAGNASAAGPRLRPPKGPGRWVTFPAAGLEADSQEGSHC